MNIIADTHTHTIACAHAYSTLMENLAVAKQKKIKFLCRTEHGPALPDAPHIWNIESGKSLPKKHDGVFIINGVEANIIDYKGGLDVPEQLLAKLDWVIASYHNPCIEPTTKAEHTDGWIAIAENKDVDVIGHCGDIRFDFDHERAIKAFAKNKKIVEVNNSSPVSRPGSSEQCIKIIKLCKHYNVPVVVSSDSHFAANIGNFEWSLAVLKQLKYPKELILNADHKTFAKVINKKSGGKFTEGELLRPY